MAKCIGSITDWSAKAEVEFKDDEFMFIINEVKVGENLLKLYLEEMSNLVLDIANDYILIRQSVSDDCGDKWDSSQIQDSLVAKLQKLNSDNSAVIGRILTSKLMMATKHRYFILFSCGTIDKFQQLIQIVGRLSELDQKLYHEEQRKPLISEESITIHSLIAIWCATIEIMNSFIEPSRQLFKEQLESEEFSFINRLEFSIAGRDHAKIFLMDLVVASWIQFNRLIKFEDLVQNLPFLCPCQTKIFFETLKKTTKDGANLEFLPELLSLIIDREFKPSMTTQSIRHYDIIPLNPCYSESDQPILAYFVFWHLYSLSRVVNDNDRHIILHCRDIIRNCFALAIKQFIPTSQQKSPDRLSPHQEERFKLMFLMINFWCEKDHQQSNLTTVLHLFSTFEQYWDIFGEKYFDKPYCRIEGLTIFQLFAKLLDQSVPSYTTSNKQADTVEAIDKLPPTTRDEKEKKLGDIWGRFLARSKPKLPAAMNVDKQSSNASAATSATAAVQTSSCASKT